MTERILVTGAAGFIGSQLTERLLAHGDAVVGVDNFDPFYPRALKERNLAGVVHHPRFRLVEADCTNVNLLDRLVPQGTFDAAVHLAAKAGVRPSLLDPVGYAVNNVVGTQAILELLRRRCVGRLVFGSSSSVYGNNAKVPFNEDDPVTEPISPYAATKRAGELLCYTHHLLYGTRMAVLRFFTVYGPRQRPDLAIRKFTRLLRSGLPVPLFGDGRSQRDYTWIDDILDGVEAAIDHTADRSSGFEIMNLGGNRTTSLRRLVELLADAVGVEPRVEMGAAQPGDVLCTYADITKAGRILGYAPKVPIEDGIPRFVAWLGQEEPDRGARAPTGPRRSRSRAVVD